jgi:hypothetical protein
MFSTEHDFENHIQMVHSEMISMFSVIERTSLKRADIAQTVSCRLCQASLSLQSLRKHLGSHQQQLALFALPPNTEGTEDDRGTDSEDALNLHADDEEVDSGLDNISGSDEYSRSVDDQPSTEAGLTHVDSNDETLPSGQQEKQLVRAAGNEDRAAEDPQSRHDTLVIDRFAKRLMDTCKDEVRQHFEQEVQAWREDKKQELAAQGIDPLFFRFCQHAEMLYKRGASPEQPNTEEVSSNTLPGSSGDATTNFVSVEKERSLAAPNEELAQELQTSSSVEHVAMQSASPHKRRTSLSPSEIERTQAEDGLAGNIAAKADEPIEIQMQVHPKQKTPSFHHARVASENDEEVKNTGASSSNSTEMKFKRRPTITRDPSREEDCQDPNCTTCVPTTNSSRRRRPEMTQPESTRAVPGQPLETITQRSDPNPYYSWRPAAIQRSVPSPYYRGPTTIQTAQTRRNAPTRRPSTSITRPRPQSFAGTPEAGFGVPGMPAPYPNPPDVQYGPPPSNPAYYIPPYPPPHLTAPQPYQHPRITYDMYDSQTRHQHQPSQVHSAPAPIRTLKPTLSQHREKYDEESFEVESSSSDEEEIYNNYDDRVTGRGQVQATRVLVPPPRLRGDSIRRHPPLIHARTVYVADDERVAPRRRRAQASAEEYILATRGNRDSNADRSSETALRAPSSPSESESSSHAERSNATSSKGKGRSAQPETTTASSVTDDKDKDIRQDSGYAEFRSAALPASDGMTKIVISGGNDGKGKRHQGERVIECGSTRYHTAHGKRDGTEIIVERPSMAGRDHVEGSKRYHATRERRDGSEFIVERPSSRRRDTQVLHDDNDRALRRSRNTTYH